MPAAQDPSAITLELTGIEPSDEQIAELVATIKRILKTDSDEDIEINARATSVADVVCMF